MDDLKRSYTETISEWKEEWAEVYPGRELTNADIASILGISREHFQKLIGDTYPIKQKHLDILKVSRDRWREGMRIAHDVIKNDRQYKARAPKTEDNPEREGVIFVPIAAQANYSQHYTEPLFINQLERIYIPGFPYRGDRYRIFEVAGQSMEPTFKEGYYVVTEQVEPSYWHQVADFYVYVIVTRDQVMLKRVYKKSPTEWVLISDNEDFHPQIPLPVSEIKEVWYVKRKIDWEMPPPKRFEIKA